MEIDHLQMVRKQADPKAYLQLAQHIVCHNIAADTFQVKAIWCEVLPLLNCLLLVSSW